MKGELAFHQISFRPLAREDFTLLQRWLCEPHVIAWWKESLDPRGIETKYGPRVDGLEPVHVFLIQYDQRPIGLIQWYRWADHQEHGQQLGTEPGSAGIDLAIGEPDLIGKGLGASLIQQFADQIVFAAPFITGIVTDVEEDNLRSISAFKKAGFQMERVVKLAGDNFNRCVMRKVK